MNLDPRTPVIVGVGQVNGPDTDDEPADLLVEAARRAGADSGARTLLSALDSARVVRSLSWPYRDLAGLVAERLGNGAVHTVSTTPGGQIPQALVHRSAADIADGVAEVILIGGVECWKARTAAKGRGARLEGTVQPDHVAPSEVFGAELGMSGEVEQSLGLVFPVQFYPLFEIALRARLGLTPDEHRQVISELWARFSDVAAGNPHAALARPHTATEIATPAQGNRMIGFPYTKLLCSNNAVNQAAALLLTSFERARRAGVALDRMVFPWAGAEAEDTPHVSHRADLAASPPIRAAAQRAFALAGVGVDDLALCDVYSCFPSAVQIAAREIGLDQSRPLTVTGGLTFAGGPWNNYVTHAVATMVERLREHPGGPGLCTANGGLLTKHAVGLYSAEPPPQPFRAERLGAVTGEARELATGPVTGATVESYTVMHDREGRPERAFLTALLPDGRRAWGTSTEPDTLRFLITADACGAPVDMTDGHEARLVEPAARSLPSHLSP